MTETEDKTAITLSFITGIIILISGIVVNYAAIEFVVLVIMVAVFFSRGNA